MNVRAAEPVVTPDAATLIARARDLVPWLREHAAALDVERRIPDEHARRLIDAGFFRICTPRQWGGLDLPPSTLWQVSRHVASGCPSTGWILGLIGISPWIVGMFEQEAQAECFASGNPIVPVLTGGVGRGVTCTAVEGGYRISGLWRYGTGNEIADWMIVMIPVRGADGSEERRLFLVRRREFGVDHDSWHVLGMRGTGSKDVTLADCFVPAHRSLSWSAAQRGDFPGRRTNPDRSYDMPVNAFFAFSVTAPIIGAAYGMVDTFVETLRTRIRAGTGKQQALEAYSQVVLAECKSSIDMSFALLVADTDEMYRRACDGDAFSDDDRARLRMHAAATARNAVDAANRLAQLLAGSLLPSNTAPERTFRDLNAMASHFLMQPEIAGELYGCTLLGLPLPPGARL